MGNLVIEDYDGFNLWVLTTGLLRVEVYNHTFYHNDIFSWILLTKEKKINFQSNSIYSLFFFLLYSGLVLCRTVVVCHLLYLLKECILINGCHELMGIHYNTHNDVYIDKLIKSFSPCIFTYLIVFLNFALSTVSSMRYEIRDADNKEVETLW